MTCMFFVTKPPVRMMLASRGARVITGSKSPSPTGVHTIRRGGVRIGYESSSGMRREGMFKERAQIGQDRRSNSSHCEESFTCKMGNANCF